MNSTKLTTDKVTKFIGSAKNGKTATQVAERFGVAKTTASRFLGELVSNNQVQTNGTKKTGLQGRPAFLYTPIASTQSAPSYV